MLTELKKKKESKGAGFCERQCNLKVEKMGTQIPALLMTSYMTSRRSPTVPNLTFLTCNNGVN